MKWKITPAPKLGDVKHVKAFAFFPVRVGNNRVWLERIVKVKRYAQFGDYCKWITDSTY